MMKRCFLFSLICLGVLFAASAAADTVSLTATVPSEHTVTITVGEHGSYRYGGQEYTGTASIAVQRFGSSTVVVVPEAGYKIGSVTVSSGEYLEVTEDSIIISGIAEDVFIELSFEETEIHWSEPIYKWSDDSTSVTASCVALNDPTLRVTETVAARRVVIVSPTEGTPGIIQCTSEAFENELFTVQVHAATIPALGTLRLLKLPDDLILIDTEAFIGCAFEAVIVPDGCLYIGSHAFANCDDLQYVKIPSGTVISEDAFEECPKVIIDRAQ